MDAAETEAIPAPSGATNHAAGIVPAAVFDKEAHARALRKWKDDPAALTKSDLQQLACYCSDAELQDAIDAQRRAKWAQEQRLVTKGEAAGTAPPAATLDDYDRLAGAIETFITATDAAARRAAAESIEGQCWPLLPIARWLHAMQVKNSGRNEAIAALEKRVLTLTALVEVQGRKIDALESRPKGMTYCGTYKRHEQYVKGDVVTHDGSAWVVVDDMASGPPPAHGWQLCVKRGADGRHAEPRS